MHVTYTPPLMEQIRLCRVVIVVLRAPNGGFVQQVDPTTREVTGVPQQFRKTADGKLLPLPEREWITAPLVMDISGFRT